MAGACALARFAGEELYKARPAEAGGGKRPARPIPSLRSSSQVRPALALMLPDPRGLSQTRRAPRVTRARQAKQSSVRLHDVIDDVDDAVRLQHIRDGDAAGVTRRVIHGEVLLADLLDPQRLTVDGL